ncbi:MAG: AMP-binding protein [Sphaerochaetaceae bacterium]|nr:AMP-binding protein [Sphaerochaetaceae bacterium]
MKVKHNPKPWDFLDSYRGKNFEGEWPTLVEMFEISTIRYPSNKCFEAYTPDHDVYDYMDVNKIVKRVANFLIKSGIKHGDKVGLTGKNSPEWGFAYLGTLFAGAVIVPIDYSLSCEEISKLMQFADVKFLFADEEKINKLDIPEAIAKVSLEKSAEKNYILNKQEKQDQKIELPKADEVAAILFTSGTTGTPKGVQLTHENFVSDCYLAQGNMNIFPTDIFYAILPIHHAYTMLAVFIESLSVGAACVFGKKLIISQIFKEMRDSKVTMFLGVPMLFNKLIAGLLHGVREKGIFVYGLVRMLMGISGFIKKVFHVNPGKRMFGFLLKQIALENNRICICGGGPLPSSTFKHFNELGIDFVQGYGLTETSPIDTLNPIFAYEETSIGKISPGIEMKVVDPDSEGNGVLYVRGPNVMKGYYKNQEATDEIINREGWLNTGDVGHIDAKNYVYLTGRKKNIIVTAGGKNVFPEEVEDHFQLYNDIEQICVAGYVVDKKTKSEAICAIIYPSESCIKKYQDDKKGLDKYINSLVDEVDKDLISYKKIRKVVVVDEPMEMTSTKKIQRFKVFDKYKELINE